MAADKKFAEHVFVTWHEDGDYSWLNASAEAIDAVEENGPTRVATYKLVEVNSLTKRVVSKVTSKKEKN